MFWHTKAWFVSYFILWIHFHCLQVHKLFFVDVPKEIAKIVIEKGLPIFNARNIGTLPQMSGEKDCQWVHRSTVSLFDLGKFDAVQWTFQPLHRI